MSIVQITDKENCYYKVKSLIVNRKHSIFDVGVDVENTMLPTVQKPVYITHRQCLIRNKDKSVILTLRMEYPKDKLPDIQSKNYQSALKLICKYESRNNRFQKLHELLLNNMKISLKDIIYILGIVAVGYDKVFKLIDLIIK